MMWIEQRRGKITVFLGTERHSSNADLAVLKEACKKIEHWTDEDASPQISVDFSHRTLLEREILRKIQDICAEYNVPLSAITIKVTESIREMNHTQLIKLMNQLEAEGFHVALDDYSLYIRL